MMTMATLKRFGTWGLAPAELPEAAISCYIVPRIGVLTFEKGMTFHYCNT